MKFGEGGFKLQSTDVWGDGGGHIGTFTLSALYAGGRVVSFEMMADNYALLNHNLSRNFDSGFVAVQKGVSALGGRMQRYKAKSNNGIANTWRHSLVYGRRSCLEPVGTDVVFVDTVSLKDMVLNHTVDGKHINAVKLDAEGVEMQMLEWLVSPAGASTRTPLNKIVGEWHFDVDRSIPRFVAVITGTKAVVCRALHWCE